MKPENSSFQSAIKSESQQESATLHQSAWFKELRFLLSALIGFILLIYYKSLFFKLSIVIDVCILILVGLLIAIMAGFPIRQALNIIIKNLLQIS